MGQGEVIEFLKANSNEWFTPKEISQRIDISYTSVTVSLKRMRLKDEVEYKISRIGTRDQYYYKFKK